MTTNIEIKRFTVPGVLEAIPLKHIHEFFQRFEGIFKKTGFPAPSYMAGSEEFYTAWRETLSRPQTLPPLLAEALLAIEDLAAPENRSRLEEAVAQGRTTSVWLDPKDPPECQALQLWLIVHPKGEESSVADLFQSRPAPKMSEPDSPSTGQSTNQFKRFTQTEVLATINREHLVKFFDMFKGSLRDARLPLPYAPSSTEDYCPAWSALLKSPGPLPPEFIEAILAIEELSAPENRERLQAVVNQARAANPWLNPSNSPECLALQLWNLSPYKNLQDLPNPPAQPTPQTSIPQPPVPLAHPMGEGSRVRVFGASAAGPVVSAPHDGSGVASDAVSAQQPSTDPPSSILDPQSYSIINLPLSPNGYHRHTGKIGQLPLEVRESVNLMMYDRVAYKEIVKSLGDYGKGLKPYHLTRWKQNGYLEWLQEQQRKDQAHAKEEFALHILREKDAGKVHEAYLQMAGSQLCQFIADFNPAVLKEKLEKDPLNFVRFLNAISKLSESGIKCESHRVEIEERQAKLEKAKAPPLEVGLSDEVRRFIEAERFNPPPN